MKHENKQNAQGSQKSNQQDQSFGNMNRKQPDTNSDSHKVAQPDDVKKDQGKQRNQDSRNQDSRNQDSMKRSDPSEVKTHPTEQGNQRK